MMRRFSRKRKSGGDGPRSTINAAEWLPRLLEKEVIEAKALEPWADSGVPDTVAAIGQGEHPDGQDLLVSFSPHDATAALLAGLAAAQVRGTDSPFTGTVLVVAPQWPAGARRLLALVGSTGYRVEPVVASALADGRLVVGPDPETAILATGAAQLAARLGSPESRSTFTRGAQALEGLAAKHGGCVRAASDRLELVVLARRVAELRAEDDSVVLEIQIGGRSTVPLSGADLAGAFDGLEGQIRRRLNDRKVREGEDGLRGRVIAQLAQSGELRGLSPWPQPGSDASVIDGVGVNTTGEPVVVAVREEIDWPTLGGLLESLAPMRSLLPVLLAEMPPPLKLGTPRLLLAGQRFADGLERALSALTVAYELRDVSGAAGPDLGLTSRGAGEGAEARGPRRGRRRGGRSGRGRGADDASEGAEERPEETRAAQADGASDRVEKDGDEEGEGASRRGGRRRRRSRRGQSGSADANAARGGNANEGISADDASSDGKGGREGDSGRGGDGASRRRRTRFEEVSLMDLDEGPSAASESSEEGEGRGSRTRRNRGRGRRSKEEGADQAGEKRESVGAPAGQRGDAATPTVVEPEPDDVDEEDLIDADDLEDILARLPDDVPDFEASEGSEESYDDDEEVEDQGEGPSRRGQTRGRGRGGAGASDADDDKSGQRRRAAILVHADRDSVLAAILLARDMRQLEGMWVYPQSELMTFFRSIATDLRDETPIYLVGFTPSPARDVVQASALYRGRLTWFDRQAWPPEDLMALRESIGRDAIHGGDDIESSMPLVLETCNRRSRFSDKLVDLATGRFSQHDFERWGRLWWWRAGEIAQKTGDVRGDIAPLLAGRPSDLAKDAARVDVPPPPAEVAYVAERDFRLVHFGGHVLVIVPVEGDCDLHLVARVARERYGASLSLAHRVGEETCVLTGEELGGKRSLDCIAVAEHLVNKHEWIEARPDADHVARFRVRDQATRPERFEELIGEIAMGRSLLER